MTDQKIEYKYIDQFLFIIFIILMIRDSFYFILSEVPRNIILIFIYSYFGWKLIYINLSKKIKFKFNITLFSFLILLLISSLWSGDIRESLISSLLQIILPTIVIMYIVNKFTIITVIKNAFYAGTVVTLFSYVCVILFPEVGLMSESFVGLWKGIYTHKNLLSVSSCLFCLISIFLFFYNKKKIYAFVAFLQILLIYFSGSSTGIIVLTITFFITIFFIVLTKIKNVYLMLSISCILILIFSVFITFSVVLIDEIALTFGKDTTFSGRTIIWDAVILLIHNNFFFGYGYGAFWKEGSYTFNFVNQYVPWTDLHHQAHNGFLDVITNIGIVGLLLILFIVFKFLRINLLLIFSTKNKVYLLPFIYLIFFIIYNFQESFLIEQNFIMWTFFIYYYLYLMKEIRIIKNLTTYY